MLKLETMCSLTQKAQDIISIIYIIHYSNTNLMNIVIQVAKQ